MKQELKNDLDLNFMCVNEINIDILGGYGDDLNKRDYLIKKLKGMQEYKEETKYFNETEKELLKELLDFLQNKITTSRATKIYRLYLKYLIELLEWWENELLEQEDIYQNEIKKTYYIIGVLITAIKKMSSNEPNAKISKLLNIITQTKSGLIDYADDLDLQISLINEWAKPSYEKAIKRW